MKIFFNDSTHEFMTENQRIPFKSRDKIISVCRESETSSNFYILGRNSLYSFSSLNLSLNIVYSYRKTNKSQRFPFEEAGSIVYKNNLYLIGGIYNNCSIPDCKLMNFNTKNWEEASDLNIARSSFAITSTFNAVYVMGGWGEYALLKTIEKFQNNNWTLLSYKLCVELSQFAAVAVSDSKILLFGGRSSSTSKISNKVWKVSLNQRNVKEIGMLDKHVFVKNFNVLYEKDTVFLYDYDGNLLQYRVNEQEWDNKFLFLTLRNHLKILLV